MTTTLDRLHVLVVDDDPVILAAVPAILESMGHSTLTHCQGLGTSGIVLDEKPHVVLLDINLPDVNGDQLVQIIQKRRWNPDEPWPVVILHSGGKAEVLEELVKTTHAAGAIKKTPSAPRFKLHFEQIVVQCAREDSVD
ncbi:MAG: response regulator [bacterium]|nr:response regulator [bacterium]